MTDDEGVTGKEYGVSLGDDENVLKLKCGGSGTTLSIHLEPENCRCEMGELYAMVIKSQRSC